MNYLLIGYIIFYAIYSLMGILDSMQSFTRIPIILMEILVALCTLAGMILYSLQFNQANLIYIWQYVFFFIVLGELFIIYQDLTSAYKKNEPMSVIIIATVVTIVLVMPALWLNFSYAF